MICFGLLCHLLYFLSIRFWKIAQNVLFIITEYF